MANKILSSEEKNELIKEVFKEIKISTTYENLINIRKRIEKETDISFNENKYPKIMYKISREEILQNNVFGKNGKEYISKLEAGIISGQITDPLTKLLYGMAWKQGDLPKLKYIIDGVIKCGEVEISQDDAPIFFQFGKHLANPELEPIIDQHVVRAFTKCFYDNKNFKIPRDYKQIIKDYKGWLMGLKLEEKNRIEFLYEIDKILYISGKALKIYKSNK